MKYWHTGLGLIGLLLVTAACSQQTHWPAQHQATFGAMSLIDPNSICSVDPLTSSSSFWVLLSAGLLTGLSHCVGMCGPLVGAFTLRRRAERQEISTPLVLFQMGRLTTYLALGAIMGGIGYFLAALIQDWQTLLSISLGLLMALLGLGLLGFLPLQRWLASVTLARLVSSWLKRLLAANQPFAPFGLGLANGLLPCGPVYAMSLLAALSGSPLKGASIMLIFGLGTLPALLGFGLSVSLLSLRLRSQLYRIAALLVVMVGLQLILRGLALEGQIAHAAIGGVMLW